MHCSVFTNCNMEMIRLSGKFLNIMVSDKVKVSVTVGLGLGIW